MRIRVMMARNVQYDSEQCKKCDRWFRNVLTYVRMNKSVKNVFLSVTEYPKCVKYAS